MSTLAQRFAALLCLVAVPMLSAEANDTGPHPELPRITPVLVSGPDPAGADIRATDCLEHSRVDLRGVALCRVNGSIARTQPPRPQLKRYRLLVERGLEADTDGFTQIVKRVLNGPSGWARNGIEFARVVEDHDLTVLLASPASVDRLCRPLRTYGWLSCAMGNYAIINAERWRHGTKTWGDNIAGYHHYLINHEVGHVLGLRHAACPSPGAPAPIMVPQTRLLDGCVANGEATATDIAMMRRALAYAERRGSMVASRASVRQRRASYRNLRRRRKAQRRRWRRARHRGIAARRRVRKRTQVSQRWRRSVMRLTPGRSRP